MDDARTAQTDKAPAPSTGAASITPRQRRVLMALLSGPCRREDLDRLAGASNSPDVVRQLRVRWGLDLPCDLLRGLDRDGRRVVYGVYGLSSADRAAAVALISDPTVGGR
jgi:hypothetical protein